MHSRSITDMSGSPKAPSLLWKAFHACSLIATPAYGIMAQALLYYRTDTLSIWVEKSTLPLLHNPKEVF